MLELINKKGFNILVEFNKLKTMENILKKQIVSFESWTVNDQCWNGIKTFKPIDRKRSYLEF